MRLISLNLNYRKWLAAISLMLLINPGVSIISIMPATRSSCVCTRKLKTICRLKFNNVDSAASIQTLSLSLSLHSSPPFTIMEARIYKRNRELYCCFTPLCYDRATNGSIKYSFIVDRRATRGKGNVIFLFLFQG